MITWLPIADFPKEAELCKNYLVWDGCSAHTASPSGDMHWFDNECFAVDGVTHFCEINGPLGD